MDLEQKSIERIKMASEMSLHHYGKPLICTYSADSATHQRDVCEARGGRNHGNDPPPEDDDVAAYPTQEDAALQKATLLLRGV